MVIQNMEFRKNQRRKFLHFRDTSYNPLWGEYIFGSEIHRCIYDNDAKDFHGQEQIFYLCSCVWPRTSWIMRRIFSRSRLVTSISTSPRISLPTNGQLFDLSTSKSIFSSALRKSSFFVVVSLCLFSTGIVRAFATSAAPAATSVNMQSNGVCTNIESRVTLNDGNTMPWFGLGVYQASNGGETEQAVYAALRAGQ
jgi:hypothetical protein